MDPPEAVVRRRVEVRGRVQGVGFRWSCVRLAEALGVAGWVRNRADGSVELVAEGAAGAVERLVDWCRSGPAGAAVWEVLTTDEEPEGEVGFRVER